MNKLQKNCWNIAIAIGSVLSIIPWTAMAGEMPEKAVTAIKKSFPQGQIRDVEIERESGTMFYTVEIREGSKKIDVEVSPSGIIGEVENRINASELPQEVSRKVAKQLEGKTIVRIEKHSRHGQIDKGQWVALETPDVFYDIKYKDGNKRKSLLLNSNGKTAIDPGDDANDDQNEADENDDENTVSVKDLPSSVKQSILAAYDGAVIESADVEEDEADNKFYEVKFICKGKSLETMVDATGKLSKMKQHLSLTNLPKILVNAVHNNFPSAAILEVEKTLSEGNVKYQVELKGEESKFEAEFDGMGNILKKKTEDDDEDDNDDNNED